MKPPDYLLPWLACTSYLTKALHAKSGHTHLKVIQQLWQEASTWDQEFLRLEKERVLHRDIIMYAWDKPCWFARTILPESTYSSNLPLFERLKDEPLGNLIFETPGTQRLSIVHYSITGSNMEYTWLPDKLLDKNERLWLRSSTFQLQTQALFYLVEILLPPLKDYSE